jgi:hypothetical protein
MQLLTDDDAIDWHILVCNLQPATWGGAEIYTTFCGLQKPVFLIKLDELECRTRSVALFSCEILELAHGRIPYTHFASL